jgi:hypothetical protein
VPHAGLSGAPGNSIPTASSLWHYGGGTGLSGATLDCPVQSLIAPTVTCQIQRLVALSSANHGLFCVSQRAVAFPPAAIIELGPIYTSPNEAPQSSGTQM